MLFELKNQIVYYLHFYRGYAISKWSTIGPTEYGFLMIGVCVVGYMLLKSANRK